MLACIIFLLFLFLITGLLSTIEIIFSPEEMNDMGIHLEPREQIC